MFYSYSSHKGYGDADQAFIIFHSWQSVPSPIEVADWYSPWTSGNDDIFDGLHQALGFRTKAPGLTVSGIASYFGERMAKPWPRWRSSANPRAFGADATCYHSSGIRQPAQRVEVDASPRPCPNNAT